ncbi:hypothetical protein OROHE_021047 [Orobanche hederae]
MGATGKEKKRLLRSAICLDDAHLTFAVLRTSCVVDIVSLGVPSTIIECVEEAGDDDVVNLQAAIWHSLDPFVREFPSASSVIVTK